MKVGITGGIGSGKTMVTKVFKALGIPVYYADFEAKQLMVNSNDLVTSIQATFGKKAYFKKGSLNREYLANTVFGDEEKVRHLNALVHPKVHEHYNQWHKKKMEEGAIYTLKEAALLFETGSYKELESVLLISAPEQVRIARVLTRDAHRTAEQVKHIIARQMPEAEKQALTSYHIINDGNKAVIPQVLEYHTDFMGKTHE